MLRPKQLSLSDIYADCSDQFTNNKHQFLNLLEENINLGELIPLSFRNHFRAHFGRPREYTLDALIWALLLQKIFSIPKDTLLLIFLNYSKELRDFCGFTKVPDASKITRFKQDFLEDLQIFFDRLVDITEPICQKIDPHLACMTIFDTSGIEAFVTENNPKYANRIIRQLKAYKTAMKLDDSFDPYKAAYGSMPSHAAANPEIKQLYINGHFCYVYKFGIVTNGLGIVRHISFYNKDFLAAHPEIAVEKKADSPDEDKSVGDSRLLIPTLIDFFKTHPLINPNTFLGDAAFDTIEIYKALLGDDTFGTDRRFQKAYIPLNRARIENNDYSINEDGIPCCPNDPNLPMKPEGNTSHLRCKAPTFKFVCPKMKWQKCGDGNVNEHERQFMFSSTRLRSKYRRVTNCDNPCTSSLGGRMVYVYPEKDLRTYPGAIRGTQDWIDTYKIRAVVEKGINHFKDSFCIDGRKTRNDKSLHADLLLSGITQLLTVILADNIHQHQFIRSLKPLAA